MNNDTSHIIYQNEGFFTTNTIVQKSKRFVNAIRKWAFLTEIWPIIAEIDKNKAIDISIEN